MKFSDYAATRSQHWDALADGYDHQRGVRRGYHRRLLELYRTIIPPGQAVLDIGCGKGELLAGLEPSRGVGVDFSPRMLEHARRMHPEFVFIPADAHDLAGVTGEFDVIIFSDLVNDLWDVQLFLEQVRQHCTPATRIVFNIYSHVWETPIRLAQSLGVATPLLPQNWLTVADVRGLLLLAGFDLVGHRAEMLFPFAVPVIAPLCNRYLVKLPPFRWFHMTHVMVARPLPQPELPQALPGVSVIVPARNEAGNIAEILRRIPEMGSGTEIIFVEGNSSDDTCGAIEAAMRSHPELNCRLLCQAGTGKGDAVRLGMEQASGDILMILDADLTVAPEDLPKFYRALVEGRGEFINGVRLVYPMDDRAMRFFNLVGNKFFSMAFSWLLGQAVKDTLCGTKVLWRRDYRKIAAQRDYFGKDDPFGDFDLLFGAARLNLKIVDLPVRYGERTYGTTNISRWKHGWLLLRMALSAARRIKFT
jgi:SAM-dependent methyltransferase